MSTKTPMAYTITEIAMITRIRRMWDAHHDDCCIIDIGPTTWDGATHHRAVLYQSEPGRNLVIVRKTRVSALDALYARACAVCDASVLQEVTL